MNSNDEFIKYSGPGADEEDIPCVLPNCDGTMKFIKNIDEVEWARPPIGKRTMFTCEKCKTTAYFVITVSIS